MTTFNIAAAPVANVKLVKKTSHFINLNFEVEGHEFNSPFGLSVANTTGEDAQKLLERMVDTGNTSALTVTLKSISVGDDFTTQHEDAALDGLIKARPVSLMLDAKKKYESSLFWLDFKVTSDYFDGELPTGSIAFTAKANRETLSKLLLVLNSDDVDFNAAVREVARNEPRVIKLKKALDF
jgi:hypothetical protein